MSYVNVEKFEEEKKYKILYLKKGEEESEVISAKSTSNARNKFFKEKRRKYKKEVYKIFSIKSIYLID